MGTEALEAEVVVEVNEEAVVGADGEANAEAVEAIGETQTRAGTYRSNPHHQHLRPKKTRSSKKKAGSMLLPSLMTTDSIQPYLISDVD